MATWGLVGSRFADGASGVLSFFSKVSGDNLLTLDGTNDVVSVPSGGAFLVSGPRIVSMTVTDIDAQNGTLTAAGIAGGMFLHTSVTGAGTLTFDTGANIAAAIPALNTAGRALDFWIQNDGTQTVTLAVATGVTIADTGQTILINQGVLIRLLCTGAATFVAYSVGGS